MKYKVLLSLSFLLFCSCGGSIKKQFKISDFSQRHGLYLEIPDKYSVNNVIVTIEGSFEGKISASSSEDPFLYYTKEDLPERLNNDFYGGTAGFFIFPSNAVGKITVTMEVPYNHF